MKMQRAFTLVGLCCLLSTLACYCTADLFFYVAEGTSYAAARESGEWYECMESIRVNGYNDVGYSQEDIADLCTRIVLGECGTNFDSHNLISTIEAECAAQNPVSVPPPDNGTSNIVAPSGNKPKPDCSFFRLTSPLDGLPNGVAAFYWDPMPGAQSYQINVYGDGAWLTGFGAPAGANTVAGDVSQGAIGGGYTLYVEAVATLADGTVCTSGATVGRAASGGGGADDQNSTERSSDDDGGSDDGGGSSGGGGDDCATNPRPECIR